MEGPWKWDDLSHDGLKVRLTSKNLVCSEKSRRWVNLVHEIATKQPIVNMRPESQVLKGVGHFQLTKCQYRIFISCVSAILQNV